MRLNFEMFSTSWMRAGSADLSSARAASCSAPVVAEMTVHSSRTRSSKGEGTTLKDSQKSRNSALQYYGYVHPKGFCLKPLICWVRSGAGRAGFSVASNGENLLAQQLVQFQKKGVECFGVVLARHPGYQGHQAFSLFPLHRRASESLRAIHLSQIINGDQGIFELWRRPGSCPV